MKSTAPAFTAFLLCACVGLLSGCDAVSRFIMESPQYPFRSVAEPTPTTVLGAESPQAAEYSAVPSPRALTRTTDPSAQKAQTADPPAVGVYANDGSQMVPTPTNGTQAADAPQTYRVLYASTPIPPALYEPAEGCYISAYIPSTHDAESGMTAFEEAVGKPQAAYMYAMTIDEPFPDAWMLHCIANRKTPLFILQPSKEPDATLFDHDTVEQAAAAFGAYNMPMFVAFYPHPEGLSRDPAVYIAFWRYARSVFKTYAPKAAFVWMADVINARESLPYYPGHDAVDWVGLSLIEPLNADGYTTDLSSFDYFYQFFQQDKPVMLTALGVSHFSSLDYVYRIDEAAAELERLYTLMRTHYPRVKLINYMEYNGLETETTGNDYTVTENSDLLAVFRQITGDAYYLSKVITATDRAPIRQWMRSAFPAYFYNDTLYISDNLLRYELALPPADEAVWINGERCTDAAAYPWHNLYNIIPRHEQRQILLDYP